MIKSDIVDRMKDQGISYEEVVDRMMDTRKPASAVNHSCSNTIGDGWKYVGGGNWTKNYSVYGGNWPNTGGGNWGNNYSGGCGGGNYNYNYHVVYDGEDDCSKIFIPLGTKHEKSTDKQHFITHYFFFPKIEYRSTVELVHYITKPS